MVHPSRGRRRALSPTARTLAATTLLLAIAACSDANEPEPEATVAMCRVNGAVGTVTQVARSQVAAARRNGSYPTLVTITPGVTSPDGLVYPRVTDALTAIRAERVTRGETTQAACRITIEAPAAVLQGSAEPVTNPAIEQFPWVIDVPDITLQGALRIDVDASGRAIVPQGKPTTVVLPTPALKVLAGTNSQSGVSEEIVVINANASGPAGHGAIVRGFTFRSGHAEDDPTVAGQGILSMRVTGVVVEGNAFAGNFTERVDLRASSGTVSRNVMVGYPGGTCDICLGGPGEFVAEGNVIDGGGIPGIFVIPALLLPVPSFMEQFALPAASRVQARVSNNSVRGHTRLPVGTGLRVGAVGVGAPNVAGTAEVTLTGNQVEGNTFGLIVEASFPVAGSTLRGNIVVNATGNTFARNCQNDLLVSFSRHTTGLGLQNAPYLRNSSIRLTVDDVALANRAWYAHPAGWGNTFTLNGVEVANGTQASYSASRVCP